MEPWKLTFYDGDGNIYVLSDREILEEIILGVPQTCSDITNAENLAQAILEAGFVRPLTLT